MTPQWWRAYIIPRWSMPALPVRVHSWETLPALWRSIRARRRYSDSTCKHVAAIGPHWRHHHSLIGRLSSSTSSRNNRQGPINRHGLGSDGDTRQIHETDHRNNVVARNLGAPSRCSRVCPLHLAPASVATAVKVYSDGNMLMLSATSDGWMLVNTSSTPSFVVAVADVSALLTPLPSCCCCR